VAVETAHLKTSGMHCTSCSMLVDMTLSDLAGVSESSTDLASGSTTVTFDSDVVTIGAIIEAIRGAGYDAERVD
jgi:copper chaperone